MKSTRKYILAVCALTLGFAIPTIHAEDGTPPAAKKEGAQKRDRGDMLKEKLGLSDTQAEQIKKIQADTREQVKALREKDLEPAEKRAEMRKIHEASKAKIDAVLTAEQRAKFDEMRKNRSEGPGGHKGEKGEKGEKGPKDGKGPKGPPPSDDSAL
jgi:Spy/CpxP family protein refolding chaperone